MNDYRVGYLWQGSGWYAPRTYSHSGAGTQEQWYLVGSIADTMHLDPDAYDEAARQARFDQLGTPVFLRKDPSRQTWIRSQRVVTIDGIMTPLSKDMALSSALASVEEYIKIHYPHATRYAPEDVIQRGWDPRATYIITHTVWGETYVRAIWEE